MESVKVLCPSCKEVFDVPVSRSESFSLIPNEGIVLAVNISGNILHDCNYPTVA